MSTVKSLWGELPLAENLRTPATILREQASQLTELTNGLLEGDVSSGKHNDGKIIHRLRIIAPALDNYVYSIMYIIHNVLVYPCNVYNQTNGTGHECEDEQAFVNAIADILSSPVVHKAISALIAQSKSEAPLGL